MLDLIILKGLFSPKIQGPNSRIFSYSIADDLFPLSRLLTKSGSLHNGLPSPIISQDGLVYVSAQNTLFGFNAINGAIDISYTMIGGGITRSSPVMLNSRGQWGMHGFDCTRRGKRYPII